jgi:hypothetical protein
VTTLLAPDEARWRVKIADQLEREGVVLSDRQRLVFEQARAQVLEDGRLAAEAAKGARTA